MKKSELTKIALFGLTSGLLFTSATPAQDPTDREELMEENIGYHLMTKEQLFTHLNARGKKLFNSLSPEGKELALKTASARCNGTNECAGLNSCRTADNKCAGKSDCRGKGKCAISDKNLAVKLVAKKMAKKRTAAGTHATKK